MKLLIASLIVAVVLLPCLLIADYCFDSNSADVDSSDQTLQASELYSTQKANQSRLRNIYGIYECGKIVGGCALIIAHCYKHYNILECKYKISEEYL